MAIRPNGRVYPCCIFRWDNVPEDLHLDHPDVFHHPFLEDIRNQMRRGEIVDGCKTCHLNEEQFGSSMRTFVLKHIHKIGGSLEPIDEPKITYLDLALSNACNNKCRMCNPELSTSWYSDWKALGNSIPKGLLQKPQNNLDKINFSNLRFLKLIGGEPLMEQEKFIDILSKCDRKNLSVLLTTNVTLKPNEELFRLMKECKSCNINLSIDAYGVLNDFLRKGSNWQIITENIKWFYDNFNDGLGVHSVVSIYNINHLDILRNFLKEKFSKIHHEHVLVDGPDWMRPRHLPENIKLKIKDLFRLWSQDSDWPFLKILEDELSKTGDFNIFMKNDKKLSDIRNENWAYANPELYEMVKSYYE
jgi:MoaA/NifB/PqqE/SkfB family radical SAM enzyme